MSAYPCGYRVRWIRDPVRDRPVAVDLWYPAAPSVGGVPVAEVAFDYGLSVGSAAEGAAAATGAFPLVVLSHGAFGAARNYSWIAEHLARSGYVVAGVSHFGESYVYGVETIDPASVTDVTDRARDCSFVLDQIVDGSGLGVPVDAARVGAIGHSSGGATVAALAGGVYDRDGMLRYCAVEAPTEDRGCDYARIPGGGGGREAHQPRPDLRDRRITAVMLLDPALGPGFDAASLGGITVPCHVVGSVRNDFLPIEQHAARYARLIPGTVLTRLDDGQGHFIYLDVCSSDREANGVPLCRDRDGVDREATHERLREVVREFFDTHLPGT